MRTAVLTAHALRKRNRIVERTKHLHADGPILKAGHVLPRKKGGNQGFEGRAHKKDFLFAWARRVYPLEFLHARQGRAAGNVARPLPV